MKLFIPGPVHVKSDILQEMAKPMIGHRTEDFKQLLRDIKKQIQELLHTKNEVILMTNSATGVMEAGMRNLVQKKVLCLANGAFGRRWHQIAIANGKDSTLLDFGDGKIYDYKKIRKELANKYEAVAMIVNETSTGIENNIKRVREMIDTIKIKPLLMIDAVTAAFGTKLDLDKVDLCLFGTQKALALPPGLAVAILNEKALIKCAEVENRGYYFDFIENMVKNGKDFTLSTPNISLLYALKKRLDNIARKGMPTQLMEHHRRMKLVRDWCKQNRFKLFVPDKHCSQTVTVVKIPDGMEFAKLDKHLLKKGFKIANGYGPLKNKTFRITHMGDITEDDTKELLKEIEEYIA